jgi:tRNA(fMet)-specific endonuclease VapC
MELSLIDTDILSELLKRRNANVVRRAAQYFTQHQEFAISAITRYEVMRGLKHKGASSQLKKFSEFCEHAIVFSISNEILDRASDLWVEARTSGRPGRDPDLIIAATAVHMGRTLVTGNVDHFSWISGLAIEDWRKS